jgi:putative ABC transport system permease protein
MTSQLPLSGDHDEYGVRFEATPSQPAATFSTFRYAVTPGYLETMRIPLRAGRLIDDRDTAAAPRVALISESLAERRFQGTPAVGQMLRIGPAGPFTIVGIVGNVRQLSLALADTDAVYISAPQSWFADNPMSLVVRAQGDAGTLAAALRPAIWSIDKDQPIVRVATLEELVTKSAAERRFALIVFEVFALAALALAAIGTYGVMAGRVAERTREIGVRMALGAPRAGILWLILRQGLRLTATGVLVGVAGASAATGVLTSLLFRVSRLDPLTYAEVIVLLVAVSIAACMLPAYRASHVDPAITLRAE